MFYYSAKEYGDVTVYVYIFRCGKKRRETDAM